MIASQLSIFSENKPGKLATVTGILAKEKVNIRATTISTSDTFGVINLIVDDPERAQAALTKTGMLVKIRRVLAVLLDDQPGGLNKLRNCWRRKTSTSTTPTALSWRTASARYLFWTWISRKRPRRSSRRRGSRPSTRKRCRQWNLSTT